MENYYFLDTERENKYKVCSLMAVTQIKSLIAYLNIWKREK